MKKSNTHSVFLASDLSYFLYVFSSWKFYLTSLANYIFLLDCNFFLDVILNNVFYFL